MIEFLRISIWLVLIGLTSYASSLLGAEDDVTPAISISNEQQEIYIVEPTNHAVNEDAPLENFIQKAMEAPPALLTWLSIVIAVVGGLFVLLKEVVEHIRSKKSLRNSIEDEYWHRSIILPICVEPLIGFVEKHSKNLLMVKSNNQAETDAFLKDFRLDKKTILSRFYVLFERDNPTYQTITEKLDELEDYMTMYCYEQRTEALEEGYLDFHDPHGELYGFLPKVFQLLSYNHTQKFS